jgi:uncharacterized membrane protein
VSDGLIEDVPSAIEGAATEEERPRVSFWIGLVAGWVAIVIGLFGVLDHPGSANPFKVLRLLIGLNIVNDALVVPVVLLLGLVVRRWMPRWLLMPAQVWLIISGVVTLYAFPLVRSYGKSKVNPSQLPFNYSHNLLIVLGCITLLSLGLALRSRQRNRALDA